MKAGLIIFLGLLIEFQALAQEILLSGKVFLDKKPAPGVIVSANDGATGVYTDSLGAFQIRGIGAGKCKLLLRHFEIRDTSILIEVSDQENHFLEIYLKSDHEKLKEIVIMGENSKQKARKSPWTVSTIDTKEISHQSASLLSVADRAAGVRIRQNGGLGSSYNLSLNGMEGKSVRFFIDDIPMHYYGRSMDISLFPVQLVHRIEIFKGVLPVHLGADALGGGLNIVTTVPDKNTGSISYQAGSFNTHRAAVVTRFVDKERGIYSAFSGFYNHSDNNYKIEAEIIDPVTRNPTKKSFRRFHDGLDSWFGNLEAGVLKKPWADRLRFTMGYAKLSKEIQHGILVGPWAIGEATYQENSFIPSLRWEKKFGENFSADLFTNYISTAHRFTDTSSSDYSWDGNIFSTNKSRIRGELNPNGRSDLQQNRFTFTNRVNLKYHINSRHYFTFNNIFTKHSRYGKNLYSEDNKPNALTDVAENVLNVTGISFTTTSKNEQTNQVLSLKHYLRSSKGTDYLLANQMNGKDPVFRSSARNTGWSYGVSQKLGKFIVVKGSYEYSIRFPDETELFGEPSYNLISNPRLKPERSHNLNAGIVLPQIKSAKFLTSEFNFFFRATKDLIFLESAGFNLSKYQNLENSRTLGGEYSGSVEILKNLEGNFNITYFKKVKTSYKDFSDKMLLGKRIPNLPYFFWNVGLRYKHPVKLLKDANAKVQIYWNYSYYHSYTYTWEIGNEKNRPVIPVQHIQTAGISLLKKPFSVNLEVDNLTNERVYDNYFVQKPGRSINLKLIYNFL